jgi:ring-1,2-phenylacetyl-CoA epoxidase subunit PaaC
MSAHLEYLLRLGDSALILGQRLSEWCGHGPVLEEDIALTNIALDLIGQARLLLTHAARIEGAGRDEDQLAFLRTEAQYRNLTLVELPNLDFGHTVMRNLLFSAYQLDLWTALQRSVDPELAAIAAKSAKETRYHLRHASDWVVRLGDGTQQSHARAQAALDALWPYTAEFFAPDATEQEVAAAGIGVEGASLEPGWSALVRPVLEEATLTVPPASPFRSRGRLGVHTEHIGHLLTEMQYLQRVYPGAQW